LYRQVAFVDGKPLPLLGATHWAHANALPLPAAPVDKDTSATAPAQSSPAGALVELVAEAIISATGSRNAELEACTAIDVVADWLERKHSARIANGSGFADLLREMLEREAGR
ncbi:MAG: hypothetical protein ACK41W_02030, partial [Cyanobacteriota bacterium]